MILRVINWTNDHDNGGGVKHIITNITNVIVRVIIESYSIYGCVDVFFWLFEGDNKLQEMWKTSAFDNDRRAVIDCHIYVDQRVGA